MAHVLKALVGESSTSTGTGDFTLSAALAAPMVHRRFNAVCAVGDTTEYLIRHATDGTWEAGVGTYSAANTLTRTLVTDSSTGGAAISFAAGDKVVILTPTKHFADLPVVVLHGTANCAITTVASASTATFTGTITDAAVGDRVLATPPGLLGSTSLTYSARVTAANTVTVTLTNSSGTSASTNAAARTDWPITVFKKN